MRSPREVSAFALTVLALAAVLAACSSSSSDDPPATVDAGKTTPRFLSARACPENSPLTYENFGGPFFLSYCTSCHSSALAVGPRQNAPLDINFDKVEDIRKILEPIYARAADDHTTMPPAGGPSSKARQMLGDWLACGAPGKGMSFDGGPLAPPKPPPTGACAAPRTPLPAAMKPRCSQATRACLGACNGKNDDTCDDKCYAADTTPPDLSTGAPINCQSCVQQELLACADKLGCHAPVAELFCCFEKLCPAGSAPDCGATKCKTEIDAFSFCLVYATPDCTDLVGPLYAGGCFPPAAPPADGGAD